MELQFTYVINACQALFFGVVSGCGKGVKSVIFLGSAVVGALIVIICSFIRPNADKYRDLCIAVGLAIFAAAMAVPMDILTTLTPHPIDLSLYRIDLRLGMDPLPLARAILTIPPLRAFLAFIYLHLPIFLALAYGCEGNPQLIRAAVVAPVIAFLFYFAVPAVGPVHIFSNYPQNPPILMGNLYSPRNCFPSMHLGWALLMALNARKRWLQFTTWTFAVAMAVATVGLGEHYWIDLIASVPFCLGVQWMVNAWASSKRFAVPASGRLATVTARANVTASEWGAGLTRSRLTPTGSARSVRAGMCRRGRAPAS
jgi:hypothetical protein